MKLNKKYIAIGISFLVLCWIGNIIYYKDHVLKEPLFIKHYYDVGKGDGNFNIFYIQNINSKNKITSIIFPEIGQQELNFTEYDGEVDKKYYMLKNVNVKIINDNEEDIPDEYKNKVITKAQVQFSDGTTMDVNLGKIYLYSDEIEHKDLGIQCTQTSSYTSGSTTSTTTLGVHPNTTLGGDDEIKITGISSNFDEEIKDIIHIYVNEEPIDKDSFPIYLKKDDTISFGYAFDYSNNIKKINNAYFLKFNVLTEDPEGDKGSTSFNVYSNMPAPTNFDINSLKADLGGE